MGNLFWERFLPMLLVLLAALAASAAGRAVAPRQGGRHQGLRHALAGILQALIYLGILTGAMVVDRAMHGNPRGLDMTLRCGSAVALLWAGFLAFDVVERHLHARFLGQGRSSPVTVLPLLDKVAKAVWALLILLIFLENMGMNVKALLAGLGVGGLAVALAGQKTIENLFGGLMLVLDQPVRAGDVCGFGAKSGEVLEVGLRSIKLRTEDRTVISVPNGEFSQLVLENFSRRDNILFDTKLGLRLDTGVAQMKRIVEAMDAVLKADTQIAPDLVRRVRFVQVSACSLDIDVYCYFKGSDWEAFMLWRQALLETLLEAMEKEGGRLAFPTQTLVSEGPQKAA
jgi:MscS family membrane protein